MISIMILRVLTLVGVSILVNVHAVWTFSWIDNSKQIGYNCNGSVVDAVCCMDSHCSGTTEEQCLKGTKEFMCAWKDEKCSYFRDSSNNVCCLSDVKSACVQITKGECPDEWQVPENCCSEMGRKWNDILVGVKPGHVCCNAPCTEMEKSGCALPDTCAPQKRSLGMNYPPAFYLGFKSPVMQSRPYKMGNILHNTGFGQDTNQNLMKGLSEAKNNVSNVNEVTVDDLMSLLQESLYEDKDANVLDSVDLHNQRPYGPQASSNYPALMRQPYTVQKSLLTPQAYQGPHPPQSNYQGYPQQSFFPTPSSSFMGYPQVQSPYVDQPPGQPYPQPDQPYPHYSQQPYPQPDQQYTQQPYPQSVQLNSHQPYHPSEQPHSQQPYPQPGQLYPQQPYPQPSQPYPQQHNSQPDQQAHPQLGHPYPL